MATPGRDFDPHPDIQLESREEFDARLRAIASRSFRKRVPGFAVVILLTYAVLITLAAWTNWSGMLVFTLWIAWLPFLIWRACAIATYRRRIIDERQCFNCGEPLLDAPLTDHGLGRCPNCGESFNLRLYKRP